MFWLNYQGIEFIFIILAIVIGFTVHEFFHAYTSYKLGDYLVKNDGRVTLNPLKHVDISGFIFIILLGFGWAKPVEVHPHLYKNPIKDEALVSLAGPLSNIAVAIIAIILNVFFKYGNIGFFLNILWMMNIGMAIFNLLPIPPLDGSHILKIFMKADTYAYYIKNQIIGWILIVIMIYTNFLSYIFTPIFEFITNFIY